MQMSPHSTDGLKTTQEAQPRVGRTCFKEGFIWRNWNTWLPFITSVKPKAGLRAGTPPPHRWMLPPHPSLLPQSFPSEPCHLGFALCDGTAPCRVALFLILTSHSSRAGTPFLPPHGDVVWGWRPRARLHCIVTLHLFGFFFLS